MVTRFTVGEDRFEAASNAEANARSWPATLDGADRFAMLPRIA